LVLDLVPEDHPFFQVEGCNVLMDVPVTPFEAASGVRIEVPTVHGATSVSLPPGVAAGQRIVLRGLGLPDPEQAGRKGTQILRVLIQLPPRLGPAQIALLAELDGGSGFAPRAGIWDDV
jgi:curved DNA-binding protein